MEIKIVGIKEDLYYLTAVGYSNEYVTISLRDSDIMLSVHDKDEICYDAYTAFNRSVELLKEEVGQSFYNKKGAIMELRDCIAGYSAMRKES